MHASPQHQVSLAIGVMMTGGEERGGRFAQKLRRHIYGFPRSYFPQVHGCHRIYPSVHSIWHPIQLKAQKRILIVIFHLDTLQKRRQYGNS